MDSATERETRAADTDRLAQCFMLLAEAKADAPLTEARYGALKAQLELLVLEADESNRDEMREVIGEPLYWLKPKP